MDFMLRLSALCLEAFGRTVVILGDDANPVPDWGPNPPTTEELATFAEIIVFARSGITGITFAEWQALDAAMADDRAFRQQTRAQFLAKTQAQQARELFDVVTAHSKMLRALIRDRR